jgi:hypothetical protein
MSPVVIGAENDFACEGQQTEDPSPRQSGRPSSTNPQLSDSNINLILGPRWVLDTKTDCLTDRRSKHNFDFDFDLSLLHQPALSIVQ